MKFFNILYNDNVSLSSSGFINDKFTDTNVLSEDDSCWKVSNQKNPWIKFGFDHPVKVEYLSLRFPLDLNLGYPIKYKLEGKLHINSKWTTLVEIELTEGYEDCINISKIENPCEYKFYRLFINECAFDVDNDLYECCISNIKLFGVDDLYLINDNGEYKTIKDNELVKLDDIDINKDTFYEYGFEDINDLNNVSLDNEFEILVYSNKSINEPVVARIIDNSNLLVKQEKELNLEGCSIDNVVINSNKTFKALMSNDNGNTWLTYKDGKWIKLEPTVENVLKDGVCNFDIQFVDNWDIFKNKSLKFLYQIDNNLEIQEPLILLNFSGTIKKAIYGVDYICEFISNDEVSVELLSEDKFRVQYK